MFAAAGQLEASAGLARDAGDEREGVGDGCRPGGEILRDGGGEGCRGRGGLVNGGDGVANFDGVLAGFGENER